MSLYLDTSALVKLLVEESGSEVAGAAYAGVSFVSTSAIAHVEASAALARMRKGARLSNAEFATALGKLEDLWDLLFLHEVTDGLIGDASTAAREHALRAYDALHLASLTAFAERPLALACWDRELREAAASYGIALVPEQI